MNYYNPNFYPNNNSNYNPNNNYNRDTKLAGPQKNKSHKKIGCLIAFIMIIIIVASLVLCFNAGVFSKKYVADQNVNISGLTFKLIQISYGSNYDYNDVYFNYYLTFEVTNNSSRGTQIYAEDFELNSCGMKYYSNDFLPGSKLLHFAGYSIGPLFTEKIQLTFKTHSQIKDADYILIKHKCNAKKICFLNSNIESLKR